MAPSGEKKRFYAHQKILLQLTFDFRMDVKCKDGLGFSHFRLFVKQARLYLENDYLSLFDIVRIANMDIASVILPFSTISTAV